MTSHMKAVISVILGPFMPIMFIPSPLRLISICGVLLMAAFTSGCATFTKSESQPVAFSSEPQGATVSINGVPSGITPVTIMITRKYGDQTCAITRDGYQTEQFKLQKHVAGMTFGNIIFNPAVAIIGVGVDVATGKATNYQESVQVKLIPLLSKPDVAKTPMKDL